MLSAVLFCDMRARDPLEDAKGGHAGKMPGERKIEARFGPPLTPEEKDMPIINFLAHLAAEYRQYRHPAPDSPRGLRRAMCKHAGMTVITNTPTHTDRVCLDCGMRIATIRPAKERT